VTRLGDCLLPILNTKVAENFELLFPPVNITYWLWPKWVGLHFGRLFSQPRQLTLFPRPAHVTTASEYCHPNIDFRHGNLPREKDQILPPWAKNTSVVKKERKIII
jgi:hypothetical protein